MIETSFLSIAAVVMLGLAPVAWAYHPTLHQPKTSEHPVREVCESALDNDRTRYRHQASRAEMILSYLNHALDD